MNTLQSSRPADGLIDGSGADVRNADVLDSGSPIDVADPVYTPAERRRRDATPWTLVQGVLAPLQFLVFLVSLALVWRFLATGEGAQLATASVVLKTLVLYVIMITGSIWERVVFGKWLFARPFFWEDVVSMLVMALHTLYVLSVLYDWFGIQGQMYVALAAYAAYVINAAQFLIKFRMARRRSPAPAPGDPRPVGS